MGKTLLSLKLAQNWADKSHLQRFTILFVVYLTDFRGTIEDYIKKELVTSDFNEET